MDEMQGKAYRVDDKPKNGCFIKAWHGVLMFLILCMTIIGVSLIVHFTEEKSRNCIESFKDSNLNSTKQPLKSCQGNDTLSK